MQPPRTFRRSGAVVLASLTLAALIQPISSQAAPDPVPKTGIGKQVTLITGDRITVLPGQQQPLIDPGPGRDRFSFSSRTIGNHLYVVPSDVAQRVADESLDRRLFDVTGLIDAGYDDASTPQIPLLVESTGSSRFATSGATVTRELSHATALKVAKTNASRFLPAIPSGKVWLDGKRKLSLDVSVPQIGAPAAWAAGYTGKGVAVAVLDSGIDATHADLAAQIAGAKNFTTETPDDLVGHGTHVASTIAGTAAASNGKYKGVAPDARLYDGKICELSGCYDSDILAGMEWAATEVKAKVINMSLGGTDQPGIDPLEEAVNRLTAETGTLFVIAAGNEGSGESTVGSPGSADAALTVGAVDKQDKLADFSSRGPRVGDHAIKPDVTAPGVGIVAARAHGTNVGTPIDDNYTRLSGTSMATPHVAGAAALLSQEHPTWSAAELKAVLMGSAKVAADQTVFQQGAGRIDVAKAITQQVIAEPGSLSFGLATWPHTDDTPVTKTLTYRNLGDQPVTLRLTGTMTASNGSSAPAGALRLSSGELTVPAGGTASVEVTSATNHSGPEGSYSGRVTATAPGLSLDTPLAVDKERESYNLTVKHFDAAGDPFDGLTYIVGFADSSWMQSSGTATLRLPRGEYLVEGDQFKEVPGSYAIDTRYFVQPKLDLTADTTIVMDARQTKPVQIAVPRADAALTVGGIGYDRHTTGGGYTGAVMRISDTEHLFTAGLGESLLADQFTAHLSTQWARENADGSYTDSPYLYGLLDVFPGKLPDGFQRTVRDDSLAKVETAVNATSDRRSFVGFTGAAPNVPNPLGGGIPYTLPTVVHGYLDATPATWKRFAIDFSVGTGIPIPTLYGQLISAPKPYRAGRTYREQLSTAVFTPQPTAATREGDKLSIAVAPVSDAEGSQGVSVTSSTRTRLFANGRQVVDTTGFGELTIVNLPAEKTTYRIDATQTRSAFYPMSTRTDLSWTFTSAAGTAKLPLVGVRFKPEVDATNAVRRTPVTALPIVVDPQPGAALPNLRTVGLQVSGDDGTTWHPAKVVRTGDGRYLAIFETPKDAKGISLKTNVVDNAGTTTDLTVINAYLLQ
ncbi:S8 family serine peptidase [Kribbella sp. NBC_01505]|uniref:S8 family serine peptidase n=1 Tax=Kribbella sp. NBC_01505 TaxID=2903580 RepID=UPI00386543C5